MTRIRSLKFLSFLSALAVGLLTWSALADAQPSSDLAGKTYHFGTHPARTTITFVSEADLETIHGVTHTVSGTVKVDKGGQRAAGVLRVGVQTLRTGIELRDEHLRSPTWLDVRKYPTIRLQLVEAVMAKDGRTWQVKARLTIKGVSRDLTTSARIRPIPDSIGKVLGAGSWVRVRTKFEVKLSDFGIRVPQKVGSKVSETWAIGVDLYGTSAAPKRQ